MTEKIQVTAYAGSFRVFIEIEPENGLPHAHEIVESLEGKGYTASLGGVNANEIVETMTHIARRDKTDGTMHIALYHENPELKSRFTHIYMDSDAIPIPDFERAIGMPLSSIPVYPAKSHPMRDDTQSNKFIVRLPSPVQVVMSPEPYFNDKGEQAGVSKVFQRFLNAPSANKQTGQLPQAESHWTSNAENVKQWIEFAKDSYGGGKQENLYTLVGCVDKQAFWKWLQSYDTGKAAMQKMEELYTEF